MNPDPHDLNRQLRDTEERWLDEEERRSDLAEEDAAQEDRADERRERRMED
jgi:hypothetical protein